MLWSDSEERREEHKATLAYNLATKIKKRSEGTRKANEQLRLFDVFNS